MSTGVILLAAGSGRRFGGRVPKQFQPFKNEPLFLKSVRTFASVGSVKELVVVVSPSFLRKTETLVQRLKIKKKLTIVPGGRFRGESVRDGLLGFEKPHPVVLVHDTARALTDATIIKRVETGARNFGVALAAWPLADTLKESGPNYLVKRTIPRKNLWVAQTPQGFRWKIALHCLMNPDPEATDDVELAQRKGYRVKLVPGSAVNFKITVRSDLQLAEKLMGRHPRMSLSRIQCR